MRPVNDCKQHEKHARAFGQSRRLSRSIQRSSSRALSLDESRPSPDPLRHARAGGLSTPRARDRRRPRVVAHAARPFDAPRARDEPRSSRRASASRRPRAAFVRAASDADGALDRDVPVAVSPTPHRARVLASSRPRSPSTRRHSTREFFPHHSRASRPPRRRARRHRASRSSRSIAHVG